MVYRGRPFGCVVAASALLAVAACGGHHAATAVSHSAVAGRSAGWTRLAIAGHVRDIAGPGRYGSEAVAVGVDRDGRPMVVTMTGTVARKLACSFRSSAAHDGLASVGTDWENTAVVTRARPGTGEQPEIWWSAPEISALGTSCSATRDALPRDRAGVRPVWIEPLADGEEDYRFVGVVPDPGAPRTGGAVHVWDGGLRPAPIESSPLYVQRNPYAPELLVGTTETTVDVAGSLSRDRADPGAPSLWEIEMPLDERAVSKWQRIPLRPAPDVITDIAYWELGEWVAAARQRRPVVYDFDRGTGTMPVPDTRLDARHPTVLIGAAEPDHGPALLATQSVDGPTAWLRTGTGYRRIPAPRGHLEDATMSGHRLYLLVDGAVWTRALPPPSWPSAQDVGEASRAAG